MFRYHTIDARFKNIEEVGKLGIGLFSVYELRNLFSHGSLSFPEPDGENQPISAHNDMISYATRIVLLSIQMLLLAYFEHSEQLVSSVWEFMNGNEEIPLWLGLERCHLVDRELAEQLSLL